MVLQVGENVFTWTPGEFCPSFIPLVLNVAIVQILDDSGLDRNAFN